MKKFPRSLICIYLLYKYDLPQQIIQSLRLMDLRIYSWNSLLEPQITKKSFFTLWLIWQVKSSNLTQIQMCDVQKAKLECSTWTIYHERDREKEKECVIQTKVQPLHKKRSFPLTISSVNVTKSTVSCVTDLVTFTEEVLNKKLHFLCSELWSLP